jgi:flagellar biosynthesis/type III secretory pathway protein FliH
MGYTDELERLYAEWEQQVQQKSREQGMKLGREQGMELGREQGMELGMRKVFATVYRLRFGQMSDDARAALAHVHDQAVLLRLVEAVAGLPQAEVDAAIRDAAAAAA